MDDQGRASILSFCTLAGTRATYERTSASMVHSGLTLEHRARALASHPLTHLGHGAPPRCVELSVSKYDVPSCSATSRSAKLAFVASSSEARTTVSSYVSVVTSSPAVTTIANAFAPYATARVNVWPDCSRVPLTLTRSFDCVSVVTRVTATFAVSTPTKARYALNPTRTSEGRVVTAAFASSASATVRDLSVAFELAAVSSRRVTPSIWFGVVSSSSAVT